MTRGKLPRHSRIPTNGPHLADQCRLDMVSVRVPRRRRHEEAQNNATLMPHQQKPIQTTSTSPSTTSSINCHVVEHWGARSAPQLPFPRLSDPRKAARRCQLTLTLPLRGSLVISGGIPVRGLGYPWVFVNPQPVPPKTRAHGRGCGF